MKPTSEAGLARVVVEWLTFRGFDVFQEVELVARGIRADIVARRGPELTIVETKTSASLALLGQVMDRRRFAHRVYAACPFARDPFPALCEAVGVGLLRVHVGDESTWGSDPRTYTNPSRVDEHVAPRRWNRRPVALAAKLRPEHRTACAAGSPTGGHWSRWRDTCAQLAAVVAAEPGIALREAIARIQHHYASRKSARGSLARDIERGIVPGVRIVRGALWPGLRHDWFLPSDAGYTSIGDYESCRRCGVVRSERNAALENCNGVVRIALRGDQDNPGVDGGKGHEEQT